MELKRKNIRHKEGKQGEERTKGRKSKEFGMGKNRGERGESVKEIIRKLFRFSTLLLVANVESVLSLRTNNFVFGF